MTFLESSESLGTRMRPFWEKGVADFESSHPLAKPVVGAGGSIGAVAGAVWSVPKTLGVAAFEYYDNSFGKSRGRTFFDYVTNAPVVHTMAFAGLAGLLGAGIKAAGITLPPDLGISSSFTAGAFAYVFSHVGRTFPRVFGSTAAGLTGQGLTLGRHSVDRLTRPQSEQPTSAWKVASAESRAAAKRPSVP